MNPSSRPVLLVDDNPDDADFFSRSLLKNKFENLFFAVSSADDAILYLSGEGKYADRAQYPLPYLLLIDPTLPGTSGWELLQWVRQQRNLRDVIILIYGGSGTAQELEKAQSLGANGYDPKPATLDHLDILVKRIGEFWLMGAPSV
jgi:CheY-like chemotaxis protein